MRGDKMLLRFERDGDGPRGPVEAVCTALEGEGPQVRPAGSGFSRLAVRVLPVESNVAALAALGLDRRAGRRMEIGRVEIDGCAGAAALSAAAVSRMKIRAGLARRALEFEYHFLGRGAACTKGKVDGRGEAWFSFEGCRFSIDGRELEMKEFSLCVNNNIFVTAGENGEKALSPGRQAVTGYICASGGADLLDGGVHSLRFELPARRARAVIALAEATFNWRRRIETAAAGPLDVLYFEDACGGLTAGLGVALEEGLSRAAAAGPLPAGCA